MDTCKDKPAEYIGDLVQRARQAQNSISTATQDEVDAVCAHLAWSGIEPSFAMELAQLAYEESGLGNAESKYAKIQTKVKGTYRDTLGGSSVGIIEVNHEKGLIKIAKPIGVIGALIPCTNPEATPFCKAISAIKTRNAIIMSPHPRTRKTGILAVERMRKVLASLGIPEDLIIIADHISLEITKELMKQADMVLATGGSGMVKAAYSSGTPALGVGAGNAVVIVDDTVDLSTVANMIKRSKTFDNATSCSAENACLAQRSIYPHLLRALEEEGGYLVTEQERVLLENCMWKNGVLNRDIVGKPAVQIGKLAGIQLPEDCQFIMVEGKHIGADDPFSGEKLSVVMTLYTWDDFDEAVEMVNAITAYSGAGHSCGLHSLKKERAVELGMKVNVSRIMINQPQCLANSGAWTNGMPMTMTLGCGTWGGNSSCENITWKNLLNTTWISFPIAGEEPQNEELFSPEILACTY